MTTTGSLGLMFPPSLPIILYALVGKVSLDRLFAASAVPGAVLLLILSGYAVFIAGRHKVPRVAFTGQTLRSALRAAAWEIPLPFLIVGGIYSGKFTASEAAAVMSAYVVFVEVFVYRELKFSDLPGVMTRSMMLVGAIMIVLGTALGLTGYMIDAEIPSRLFELLSAHIKTPWPFLALLNVFLLIINMVEIFGHHRRAHHRAGMLHYGIDPIHLGTLFLLNLEPATTALGPQPLPSSRRFNKPLPELYRATLPYWLIVLGALLLVTYVPRLSLWLPDLLHIQ